MMPTTNFQTVQQKNKILNIHIHRERRDEGQGGRQRRYGKLNNW